MTFIDFSVANYKCFFDPLFFNETLKKNTCTIFVVDRQLGPVANYWASLLPNINGIIYSHDSLAVVMQKIKDVIQGKRLLIHHGETLSRVQMDVFRYVMSGISIQNISKVICLSDKRVYGIKTEIETKLKGSLNHLIIGSSHARTSRDLFTPQGNEK
ncbi:hypothetical protein CIG19_05310 [Enterobacterales bacterium CwR94]|nr:hypothetical protein CIG19_05310 [Enterobacterales bacterium CwR94]